MTPDPQRGTALVASLILLIILAMLAVSAGAVSASSSIAQTFSAQSTYAFYAAESALELSLRELSNTNDYDSNGTIGSIDSQTFATTSSGYTTYAASTITAYGSDGDARRVVAVTVSP